ncbi:TlpA disulfide reductase family protein [Horticoccus sp. 23ND18S-11]|uniref:TlpA disulfide reductase family protein n=1 Tax=Horticoccus sp. 23ND18S-11 TaxID=3391832 RepID=UPI0039C972AA
MKHRLLTLALIGSLGLSHLVLAQAPAKSGDKGGDKKAPAPKTPADLAFDEFNKMRSGAGKMDQARFQAVINAGTSFLTQYSTHGRVNDVVRDLAFWGSNIDQKQAALRTSFASLLSLEVTNLRFKEGLSDPAKAAIAALDATVADFNMRETPNAENLAALREKLDALGQTPGAGRFLTERERSYAHLVMASQAGRAEAHLKTMLTNPDKSVAAMAREELNIVEVRKEPYALTFTGLDGKPVDFAQLRGKVVALYFWSSTNGNSTRNFERLKMVGADYRKRGLEMVTVSFDKAEDKEKLEKYIKENRITWPVHFDGKGAANDFARKLNANSVPRLYVFDQKGILQMSFQGSPVKSYTSNLPVDQLEPTVKRLLNIK